MKRTALILALAIALPAWGQDKPADNPDGKPAASAAQDNRKPEPANADASAKKHVAKKHSRRMEDARHCLDEPTNTAIIKCAEAYL